MRIISGSARGRRLATPRTDEIRPTTDRVREAVFNALYSQGLFVDDPDDGAGTSVVDLFAGTGAYGLEALSRGATHCTFLDRGREAIRLVTENVETFGFADRATVLQVDALNWVKQSSQRSFDRPIDLAFCDPPYGFDVWGELLESLPAAICVLESGAEIDLPSPWEAIRTRTYASTVVTLARR